MEYRTLGRTGFNVSLLSLGSGGARRLGQAVGMTQKEQTFLVRHALDLGINLIDTSVKYGDSENILGAALEDVPRESFFLSTKWLSTRDGKMVIDPDLLVSGVNDSLGRLGTDYIDIMMFHGPLPGEYHDLVEHLYPAMEQLRQGGKVRAVGISTRFRFDPEQAAGLLAMRSNPEMFDVIMLKYGILNQHAAEEIFPLAIEHNVGVMNMAAIRDKLPVPGLLENLVEEWKQTGQIPPDSLPDKDPLGWLVHDEVDSVISAGYKFAADHPAVSTVITGTASIGHLDSNVMALETPTLPAEDSKRIKALFGSIVQYA